MTSRQGTGWELGSDFELVGDEWILPRAEPPWVAPDEQVTYLESGRQALALLSAELRSGGRDTLLVPAYFCDSMLSPFLADGWRVEFLDVSRDWEILEPRTDHAPHRVAVLSLPFFGVPESERWLAHVGLLAESGAVIVSDETHRVLEPGLSLAHFRVASLRKMLPVPDGAFLVGPVRATDLAPPEVAPRRLEAMAAKTAFLSGAGPDGHLERFASAEHMTDARTSPAAMSDHTGRLIGRFDYARMASTRRDNARIVAAGLVETAYDVTSVRPGATPSHCVITGPDIRELRAHLTSRRIFCPVHWPEPTTRVRPLSAWPSRYLSIPVDHRYSTADMERVVEEIAAFAERGQGRDTEC